MFVRKGVQSNRAEVMKESGRWEGGVVLAFVAGLIRTGVVHILIIAWLIVAPRPINIQRVA